MNYYTQQKQNLMKQHKKMMNIGRPIMTKKYDGAFAETAVQESIVAFEQLIPQIPCIGGSDNPMTDTLIQL